MDLILREMITASATLKEAGASAKHAPTRLDDQRYGLVAHIGTEILTGRPEFLNAWMTVSSTRFNVNEGVSNRCRQLAGTTLGAKTPVYPVDYVNKSLSSNDTFPSARSA
jgi:fumarate hydratase class II